MKKLLVALLVIFCSVPGLSQTRKPVYVDGVNVYSKPKIYADSFDGYLNIRSAPSTSSEIIGAFCNGQVPGYVIKQEGNWAKIYYRGDVGYVYKKNTSSRPTVAVTSEADVSWLEGIWSDNRCDACLLFDNGTYMIEIMHMEEGNEVEIGTYRLAGNSVILSPFMYEYKVESHNSEYGYVSAFVYEEDLYPKSLEIDYENETIGDLEFVEYLDPELRLIDECDEYFACSDLTREEFLKKKEFVKEALKR